MSRPLAIDLFTGLHGWASGLVDVGYRVVGYDIEDMCASVGAERPEHVELVIQDVLSLNGAQFKDAALIVASPPCQEYSYMAMPWSLAKAKAAAIRADTTGAELERLNRLFNACFRIQKEASIAACRHIPMVVENVRGAIPWVGRSRWNFGSFHLWGDVPALMPAARALKNGSGGSWFGTNPDGSPGALNNARDGIKAPGQSLDYGAAKFNDRIAHFPDGRKQPGLSGMRDNGKGDRWFQDGAAPSGSKSPARKAASAMIAKIPEPLSRHIGMVYWPDQAA